jgi:hypothetical protein
VTMIMIIMVIMSCVQGVNKIDTRDYSSPHTLVRVAAYYFDQRIFLLSNALELLRIDYDKGYQPSEVRPRIV